MKSTINLYFVLIIIFIYYLYKNRSVFYNNKLQENFYSGNPFNISFLEKDASFKKIYIV